MNVKSLPRKQKSVIQIFVQNVNGTNGLNGRLAAKHVVMVAHKFGEEVNHWKQVTQSVIVPATVVKKGIVRQNFVAARILMNVARIKIGANMLSNHAQIQMFKINVPKHVKICFPR